MEIVALFAVAALAGALVKLVDQIEDEFSGKIQYKYFFALIYGLMIGYLISFSGFGSLWLAALAAQLLSGKIDKKSHMFGFAVAIIFTFIFSSPFLQSLSVLDFIIFLAAASLDELAVFSRFKRFKDYRPLLKITALVYGIFGRWDYFAGIMVFDISYYAVGRLFYRKSISPKMQK